MTDNEFLHSNDWDSNQTKQPDEYEEGSHDGFVHGQAIVLGNLNHELLGLNPRLCQTFTSHCLGWDKTLIFQHQLPMALIKTVLAVAVVLQHKHGNGVLFLTTTW